MIFDISQEVFSCAVYPGDPAPKAEKLQALSNGDPCNLTAFSMCAHNGTHIDAPAHFIENGKTVDQLSPEIFFGPAYVAECGGELKSADAFEILRKACGGGAGERILFRGNAVMTEEAARVFAEGGVLLLGCESQSFGPVSAPTAVHRILLGAEVVLLEGLRLTSVPEGKYLLCSLPLNLKDSDGSPCRAMLISRNTCPET